jgi:hypothetical protein
MLGLRMKQYGRVNASLTIEKEIRRCLMKRTNLVVFVLLFTLAVVAYSASPVNDREQPPGAEAEFTWAGKLVDHACKQKNIDHNCPVGPSTQRFGLVIDGGIILPFDEASNQMAREAVTQDGRKGNIEVSVVGGRQNGLFKLESIQVKK